MAAPCAFCGQTRPLTREHIWPRGIIERAPNYDARYIGKAEKFVGAELTVKDVCAECNSGALSSLDQYICNLWDAQFDRIASAREPRLFLYDHERLLRWLLKISYNSARANASDIDVLAKYRAFILGTASVPQQQEVRLELIRPYKRKGAPEIPPKSVRCCRIEIPANPVPEATLRLVAMNSFYFWILLWPEGIDVDQLRAVLPGTPLPTQAGRLSLFPSRDTLEVHSQWATNPRAPESMWTRKDR